MQVVYDFKEYLAQCLTQTTGRLVDISEVEVVPHPDSNASYIAKAGDIEITIPVNKHDLAIVYKHLTNRTVPTLNKVVIKELSKLLGIKLAAIDWTITVTDTQISLKPTAHNTLWIGELKLLADPGYQLTNTDYNLMASAPGVSATGGGTKSKPGKLNPPGISLTNVPSLRNYAANANATAWKFNRDLYLVGPRVKPSELTALSLKEAEGIYSNKHFKINIDIYIDDYLGYGYYDVNLDTGTWTYVKLYGYTYSLSGRQHPNLTSDAIAPPPARHIYVPCYDSNNGDHLPKLSLISV